MMKNSITINPVQIEGQHIMGFPCNALHAADHIDHNCHSTKPLMTLIALAMRKKSH
jgi:hypothetical protein